MKKILFTAFLGMVCTFANAQTGNYVINGRINGTYNADKVYLVEEEFINGPQTIIDSAQVIDGRYHFEGKTPPVVKMYFIMSADPNSRTSLTPVFLEDGTIEITTTGEQFTHRAKVSGTVNNEIMTFYSFLDNHLTDSLVTATKLYWQINGYDREKEQTEYYLRGKRSAKRSLDMQRSMVTTYNDQVFAPFMIYWEMRRDLPAEELLALRDQLAPELLDHPYTLALNEYITSTQFSVGNPMPDFELPDQNGNTVKWKEFQGKYVLVDFWASWCGPCIREMPNVVNLYKECKGPDFEIVGISLDKDKDQWLAAIEQHNMSWPQLCDFKMWTTPVARMCNVDAVPFTILVDPEGNVIALNLRGEELTAKVKELIGK